MQSPNTGHPNKFRFSKPAVTALSTCEQTQVARDNEKPSSLTKIVANVKDSMSFLEHFEASTRAKPASCFAQRIACSMSC